MLKRIEPNIKQLEDLALSTINSLGVDGAEISCSQEKGFSLNVRLGDIETLSHHLEKTFSVTIYADHRTGSASSGDFSPASIIQTINKAYAIAQYAGQDSYAGLPEKDRLALNYTDCKLSHPWEISVDEAIELALACEKIALEDKRISNSEGVSVSTFQSEYFMANTLGFSGLYAVTDHAMSCSLLAKHNGQMQRDYEYTVGRSPADLISYKEIAMSAARKTIARLNPRRLKTQNCPVIFDSSAAKSLLRAFIQAISGGNLYRKSSFLLDGLGKKVFPSFVNIQQQPNLPGAMGSAPFDHEGVLTADQFYIHDGELVSYALGSYSARKLGLSSTGNAGGVFNLSLSDSGITQAELLKEMGTGLLVTELMGQGVNITTGDYSRGAAGFWVENGEIQYPVEEITIAGNLKTMFSSIVAVANDTDIRGSIRSGSVLIDQMTISGE